MVVVVVVVVVVVFVAILVRAAVRQKNRSHDDPRIQYNLYASTVLSYQSFGTY